MPNQLAPKTSPCLGLQSTLMDSACHLTNSTAAAAKILSSEKRRQGLGESNESKAEKPAKLNSNQRSILHSPDDLRER